MWLERVCEQPGLGFLQRAQHHRSHGHCAVCRATHCLAVERQTFREVCCQDGKYARLFCQDVLSCGRGYQPFHEIEHLASGFGRLLGIWQVGRHVDLAKVCGRAGQSVWLAVLGASILPEVPEEHGQVGEELHAPLRIVALAKLGEAPLLAVKGSQCAHGAVAEHDLLAAAVQHGLLVWVEAAVWWGNCPLLEVVGARIVEGARVREEPDGAAAGGSHEETLLASSALKGLCASCDSRVKSVACCTRG